ncbi:hypothetical protein [Tautonia marina]|uniref:hypothetical protein n=1 Tax=Tautonia marina TaxID=2653855 RepID=UPI00126040A3|nr:hypothetical protein [Tautonia marina]
MSNPFDLPEHLVSRINPVEARHYVAASGWKRVTGVNGKVAVFDHPTSELDQLLIPLDAGLADYARRMAEVISTLAEHEGRPASDILDDLLLPPSDVLRFRMIGPGTQKGDVSLNQGIELLDGARKAILSAACAVVQPQKFYPRLSRGEAEQLVRACRLGQTERGSFTAVVACPLDAAGPESAGDRPLLAMLEGQQGTDSGPSVETPDAAGPEPFARQTTGLLMRSLARIASAIDGDQEDSLVEPAAGQPSLSANLCDALMMMEPEGDRSQVSVLATWARTLPPPRTATPPSAVHLRREYFPAIAKLAVKLRPTHTPKKSFLVGLVDSLHGDREESGRVSGDVQLLILNQEEKEKIRARVTLDADDYQKAGEAHLAGEYVALHGILMMGDRAHRIVEVTGFTPLRASSS